MVQHFPFPAVGVGYLVVQHEEFETSFFEELTVLSNANDFTPDLPLVGHQPQSTVPHSNRSVSFYAGQHLPRPHFTTGICVHSWKYISDQNMSHTDNNHFLLKSHRFELFGLIFLQSSRFYYKIILFRHKIFI